MKESKEKKVNVEKEELRGGDGSGRGSERGGKKTMKKRTRPRTWKSRRRRRKC